MERPFSTILAVDKEGHEYLAEMCDSMAYEILGRIEALPGRLTE